MATSEPTPTAVALLVAAALLGLSALLSRASGRLGIPFSLLFLAIGMAAGSEGIGGIPFGDYGLAFRLGTVALVLILFDGGLNTSLASIRAVALPAGILATVGVAAVAGMAAVGARLVGLSWGHALLLGAVVSSTDAAAVFSMLRGQGIQLKGRVAAMLEVESGLNDPVAVILTLALTRALLAGTPPSWALAGAVAMQIVIGLSMGLAIGYGGKLLLARARLSAPGLYAVLTLSLALIAFSVPTLLGGSGFLAVYVAAVVLGQGNLPQQSSIHRMHDALAWVGQIGMFLALGLLVSPTHLLPVAGQGIGVALFLAFVARPLMVAACLVPFHYSWREIVYVGWVGLRGAVPIILATYPVLARAPGAERVFNIVFFIVVVSALVPGWSVRWLARRLGLEADLRPPPQAVLEISTALPMPGQLLSFYVDPASAVSRAAIADLPFPSGTTVVLVVRGNQLLAPRGNTVLEPGDHVHVFCDPSERALVQLLFGSQEEA